MKELPKLTVIVPTLNRPDTLYHTLKTVFSQLYKNYSVIVSDNFSDCDVQSVLSSFDQSKLSYYRTPERLSMSHHWEFILNKVDDGFVTILGDDDGLLPGALDKVARILQKNNAEAVGWRFANFNWKGLPPHFMIPMGNYYRVVDSKKEAERLLKLSAYDTIQFPSLYGGFISMDLIKRIRNKLNGVFFHSRIPDFFSGAVVAANTDKYIRCEFPLTINATSRHSTGFAAISSKNDQTSFNSLRSNSAGNIPFHDKLIFIRSNAVPITEAMLQVHKLFPSFPQADIKKLIGEVIREAATVDSTDTREELINGTRKIAAINGLDDYCEQQISAGSYTPQTYTIKQKFSPVSNTVYFNTTGTNIDTVEDACRVVQDIIPGRFFKENMVAGKNFSRFTGCMRYMYLKLFSSYKQYI